MITYNDDEPLYQGHNLNTAAPEVVRALAKKLLRRTIENANRYEEAFTASLNKTIASLETAEARAPRDLTKALIYLLLGFTLGAILT
jgi:hypothetical protein